MNSHTTIVVGNQAKFPNIAKYGFLIYALLFTAIIAGYTIAFVKIGPADSVQRLAYVAFFLVAVGLFFVSIVSFVIVWYGFGGFRFIGGVSADLARSIYCIHEIYLSLVLLVIGSMVSSAMFNWEPSVGSASKYLRDSLFRTGKPSPFIEYVQQHGRCCGSYGLRDYEISAGNYFPIPASCCKKRSCVKNISLATKGCLLRGSPGARTFVYSKNNPTLRNQILAIELFPLIFTFLTSTVLLLFSYFHCWRMIFPESIPSVVLIVSRLALAHAKSEAKARASASKDSVYDDVGDTKVQTV